MIAVCFLPQRRRLEAGGLGPGLRPQLTLATPTFSVSCSMVQSGCCCCSGHRDHVLANGGERGGLPSALPRPVLAENLAAKPGLTARDAEKCSPLVGQC